MYVLEDRPISLYLGQLEQFCCRQLFRGSCLVPSKASLSPFRDGTRCIGDIYCKLSIEIQAKIPSPCLQRCTEDDDK